MFNQLIKNLQEKLLSSDRWRKRQEAREETAREKYPIQAWAKRALQPQRVKNHTYYVNRHMKRASRKRAGLQRAKLGRAGAQ